MKIMLISAVLFFQAASVLAGVCSPLEYAQLKNMPSKSIVVRYCNYDSFAKVYKEQLNSTREIYLDGIRKGLPSSISMNTERTMNELSADLEECLNSKGKVLDALEGRTDFNLSCSTE